MKRVFYGVCNSGSSETEKTVIVVDTEVAEESFQFEEGDLLTVFFAQHNKVSAPRLVIRTQDTEVQPSTTNDEGKFIKTHDAVSDVAEAWGDGETVIFAYTQRGADPESYYWELINAVHASESIYGVTKLFNDNEFDNINTMSTWLAAPPTTEDSNIALTPNMLKYFYQKLTDEEEETGPDLTLHWTPAASHPGVSTEPLGILTLAGNSVTISHPFITHTGELVNNGNGPSTNESEPFITRVVPDDLYFGNETGLKYGTPNSAKPRIILNSRINEGDYLVLGAEDDNTLGGVIINKPTEIKGAEKVNGQVTAAVESTNVGFTTPGIIQEKNEPLSQRYSPQLKVFKYNDMTGLIEKGQSCKPTHKHVSVQRDGWIPLGVVGYNVNMVSGHNSADAPRANVWECYLMLDSDGNPTDTVEYSIYNLRDQAIYVQMEIYILYQRDLNYNGEEQ